MGVCIHPQRRREQLDFVWRIHGIRQQQLVLEGVGAAPLPDSFGRGMGALRARTRAGCPTGMRFFQAARPGAFDFSAQGADFGRYRPAA